MNNCFRFSLPHLAIFLFVLLPCSVIAQQDSIAHRIILIGDAGLQVNDRQPELELVKKLFPLNKNTSVIYLGDNIYPQGLPSTYASNYDDKRTILDSQINLVRGTEAKAFFVPGNHDWMQGRPGGYQQVQNQHRYIQSLQLENVQYVPSDVCPGPQVIELTDKVVLVVIDSQWWLHRYEKPGVTYSCEAHTEYEMLQALKEIVEDNEDKLMIFAAHHPFITYGRHGGYYSLKQHIFPLTEINHKLYIPLPVLGSLYPLARGVFGNIQDTRHPIYKSFSQSVDSILKQHPFCIRVAGHEHNLQYIVQDDQYYVVSGAGSKAGDLSKGESLVYGSSKTGFGVLDVVKNGNVRLSFYSTMNDSVDTPLYATLMRAIDTTPAQPKVYNLPDFPDSVTIAANPNFKAKKFKKWLLGTNYRDEWTQPIRARVIDIGKEKGGLKITRRGGGMQTRSLRFEDKNGTEYVLRSIEKFPDKTLPLEFRQTFVKDAVVDGISASYPYGALSIPALSREINAPYIKPEIVYLPDDPRLGSYREDFGNSLMLFEQTEPGNYEKNSGTDKMLDRLLEDHDNRVDQKAVLRVRILDMFIMDFDRHEDQWRWVTNDTGKRKTFFPIPRDRDQAFFVNEGFIPKKAARRSLFPKFQGFRARAKDITTFNQNAVHFDRTFLNELNREEWNSLSDSIIAQFTDEVIENALRQQPEEIFKHSGEDIIKTLKERRKYLKEELLTYYQFLSKEVDISGSDKREFFDIRRETDGKVNVSVYEMNKDDSVTKNQIYGRTFHPEETDEIRVYGQGGSDSFLISGSGNSDMKIRIIGGRDKDIFINNAKAPRGKTILYDYIPEENILSGEGLYRRELSNNTGVNRYERKSFRYDQFSNGLIAGYNRDDGLTLGLSFKYTTHGFRKDPFKLMHTLGVSYALATKALMFSYNLEAINAIGSSDLLVESFIGMPRNTLNFFGFGNETVNEERLKTKSIGYYRTRFDFATAALLLRRQIAPDITLSYGPSYQFVRVGREYNEGKIINETIPEGIDTATLFHSKTYLGPKVRLNIDNRNSRVIPSRGINWETTYEAYAGLGNYSNNYSRLNSDLSIYISSNRPAKLVVALRFGTGITWGDFEYFQAQYLSGTNNLRGFRRFRFAGEKMLYNNFELRYRIAEFQNYLFSGAVGLLGFHDVGRVWFQGEDSNRWHTGYGAGVWLAPAKRIVGTVSYVRSREGGMGLASLGFHF